MITMKGAFAEALQIMLDTVSWREPEGLRTGYPPLDNLTRGMRKGSLTVLVSPPSPEKTAFALNIVAGLMGRKPETPILFCSGLSPAELAFRLLTVLSGAACGHDRDCRAEEISRLTGCVADNRDYPLFFEEHDVADECLPERVSRLCSENRIGFLIFDPVRPEGLPALRQLARRLAIPLLALVSSGRETGSAEEIAAADTVIRLVRGRRRAGSEPGVPVWLRVTRNRFGLCGACRMTFVPQTMRFRVPGCDGAEEEGSETRFSGKA